ncbi:MAG: type II toxin-antitoxin system VapC family toxin [Pacificimonas sp.]
MSGSRGNSVIRLLLDTQILVWFPVADRRLKRPVVDAIISADNELFVSAIVAWEYSDLRRRDRIDALDDIEELQNMLGFTLLDLPGDVWRDLDDLPTIHRDPADRMLISHARLTGLTLVTSDATIRKYPVESFWL